MEKLNYYLRFHPKVADDIDAFDRTLQIQIRNKLEKIQENPFLWIQLIGSLSGWRKMYVADKKIRIVYRIEQELVTIYVIAIWKRENDSVYERALKRL